MIPFNFILNDVLRNFFSVYSFPVHEYLRDVQLNISHLEVILIILLYFPIILNLIEFYVNFDGLFMDPTSF